MVSSLGDVLKIQGLKVRYPNSTKWILNGFNLKMSAGEKVALVGSSGSGKSTVAKALMQILPPGSTCSGELNVDGQNLLQLTNKNLQKIRGELIGLVFQDPMTRLNPLMTVGDHLIDTLRAHQPKASRSKLKIEADELLTKVGLRPERFNAYPHEFSGGMRQRVAIALAIALKPPLIIADEPTSSLDVDVANQVMSELSFLCDDLGSSLLLISHDLALASRWCERMSILQDGETVEEGFTKEILVKPQSFLGQRLVDATKTREEKKWSRKPTSHVVLEVERLRCWHAREGMPWDLNWVKAIDEVNFSLNAGETLGLVGVSGCGKSTLCRSLVGLLPIRGGQIRLLGQSLGQQSQKDLKQSRQSLQMVFQDPYASLNPKMTVIQNISDPILIHNLLNRSQAKERARNLLEQVGLTPPERFQNRVPSQLSGGQQQRVAIARALALRPKVLICDESVSMLDAEIQYEILALLNSLQEQLGLAILFITHDLLLARGFCHRIAVLDKGKIVEEGLADFLFENPSAAITRKLIRSCSKINKV